MPEVDLQQVGVVAGVALAGADRRDQPAHDRAGVLAPQRVPPIRARVARIEDHERPPDQPRRRAQIALEAAVALGVGDQHRDAVAEDPRQQPAARADRLARPGRARRSAGAGPRGAGPARAPSAVIGTNGSPAGHARSRTSSPWPAIRVRSPRARCAARAARAGAPSARPQPSRRERSNSRSSPPAPSAASRYRRASDAADQRRPTPAPPRPAAARAPRCASAATHADRAQRRERVQVPRRQARAPMRPPRRRGAQRRRPRRTLPPAPPQPQRSPPHPPLVNRRRLARPQPARAARARADRRVAGRGAGAARARRSDGGPPPARRPATASETAAPAARRARAARRTAASTSGAIGDVDQPARDPARRDRLLIAGEDRRQPPRRLVRELDLDRHPRPPASPPPDPGDAGRGDAAHTTGTCHSSPRRAARAR